MLLDAGSDSAIGPARALLRQPANDFVRRFFEAERLGLASCA
ncbi:MAG: hypothetical protein WKG07_11735 [Hymenobacter sp.]